MSICRNVKDIFKISMIIAKTTGTMTAGIKEGQEECLQVLQDRFPLSTDSERLRFLKSCDGNTEKASKRLRKYFDWRAQHLVDGTPDNKDETDDKDDWDSAVHVALKTFENDVNLKRQKRKNHTKIPRIVMLHTDNETGEPIREREGRLLFHVLPAQIDKRLASSGICELVTALYLERKFDRDNLQKGTLLIDVRPGVGFPNTSALMLMPFIQRSSKYLNKLFPERLHSCIVYPLPQPALWLWNMASTMIDKDVVDRIQLVAGAAAIDASPPNNDLAEYIDESILEQVESARLAAFIVDD